MSSPAAPPQPVFNARIALGLFGVLIAAMMAGLNGRVPSLVLVDLQGALGLGHDEASWLTTAYSAGELAAMPFAAWMAVTFSMRRFHLTMLAASLTLSAVLPLVHDLHLLLLLRTLHGVVSGALVPVLMMAALRFLPLSIRLHGLALFAMSATFSPNIALWLAAVALDRFEDWRWAYWHVIPIGLLAATLVAWGIPKMPPALPRLKQANWFGMALGAPGLMLLVVGVDQGVRLDWLNSSLIVAALGTGAVLTALYLLSETQHPAPFVRIDLLKRRNLWIGFICLVALMMIMATAVGVPANLLGHLHGFRMEQSASLGLALGLPQLVLGPCVALLLYRRWIDARHVFAAGLSCLAAASWLTSGLTDEWMVREFMGAVALHAIGQPLAMIAMLFLMTSVVQPMEGPFMSGLVNIVRVLSTLAGSAFITQFMAVRGRFHSEMLLDQAATLLPRLPGSDALKGSLGETVATQASVLAAADTYRVFAMLALLLIPLVLRLQYIPAPMVDRSPSPAAPVAAH